MNRSVWSRAGIGAAVSVLMAMGAGSAHAVETSDDSLSLKIASALRSDRLFMRAGVIGVSIKTKSGETYDVTGPVMTRNELSQMRNSVITDGGTSLSYSVNGTTYTANNAIRDYLVSTGVSLDDASGIANALKGSNGLSLVVGQLSADKDNVAALGTPPGVKGIASKQTGTAGFSLGYFLGDDHTWVVESYVLAAPLSTSVSATGQARYREDPDTGGQVLRPFGLEGQKILTSKLLPPTVLFGRYWGKKDAKFRPYTGIVGMYAIFTDAKATDALNNYVGGTNPGDTTVSLKNAFGLGPMFGFKYQFDDKWHASLNVGHVKLKTQATLTTRNTWIRNTTGAIQDYGRDTSLFDEEGNDALDYTGTISDTINTGEITYGPDTNSFDSTSDPLQGSRRRGIIAANGGVTGLVSRSLAYLKSQGTSNNLGTYVRRNETTLTNTIFMLSVGRSF